MNIISISNNRFKKLESLKLNREIINTEGNLYIINDKNKWKNNIKVIKKFYNDKGDGFSNKLLTINSLVDQKENIGIDELVMPEKLVVNNGQIIGFTMDYIENDNFQNILYNPKIDNKIIINYLKEIGEIFKKIEKINKYNKVDKFYLNDVHEANFILNKKTNHINVVDVDSAKISNNKPFAAKYMTPFSPIAQLPEKYHICTEQNSLGYIEPNMNSDLYCYIVMIMNYLYKGNILKLDIPEFYSYLNYLSSINFPYELLDCFSKIYEYDNNINPKDLLDLIPNDMGRAHHKVYEMNMKK